MRIPPPIATAIMWVLLPGMLLVIRGLREGGFFLPFWAVRLGDFTAFPLQVGVSTWIIQKYGLKEGKWTWLYRWPIGALLLLYAITCKFIYDNWQNGIKTGSLPLSMQHAPSEKYHTLVSPLAAVLLLPLCCATLASKRPWWVKIPVSLIAASGLGIGLWLDGRGN